MGTEDSTTRAPGEGARGPVTVRARRARPDDPVAALVGSLALAVQRHRIYPASSPLCDESIEECAAALAEAGGRAIELKVLPGGLRAGESKLPETPANTELAERLFRADVERLTVAPTTSPKELQRFCIDLARRDRVQDSETTFPEALAERGVQGIRAEAATKLDLLDFGVMSAERIERLRQEQGWREARSDEGSAVRRAWLRAETDCDLEALDLVDLAFLVENSSDLARMLKQLAEGRPQTGDDSEVLGESIAELIELYRGLSPRVANARFAALAQGVMMLEEGTRRSLTQGVLIPDLLETGKSAPLLMHFSDEVLAEGLRELGEAQIGGAGLVQMALARLPIPTERNRGLIRMLDGESEDPEEDAADSIAAGKIRLEAESPQMDLKEYAALDLAVDAEAEARLAVIRDSVSSDDGIDARLSCYANLIRHVRNPDHVEGFLSEAAPLLQEMIEREPGRAVRWIGEYDAAASDVRAQRPDIADVVASFLGELCGPDFVRLQVKEWTHERGRRASQDLLAAFGSASARPLLRALEEEESRGVRRRLVDFMCEQAERLAPGLVEHLKSPSWTVVRNVVRVLGFAGPGYEAHVGSFLTHAEPRVAREAFLALARIGSPEAADLVAHRLLSDDAGLVALAQESVWLFPEPEVRRMALELLSDPAFYRRRPALAREFVNRLGSGRSKLPADLLRPLVRYRFAFWTPRLAALAWAAARALGR